MTRLIVILAMFLLLPTACATTDNTTTPRTDVADAGDAANQPGVNDSRVTLNLGQSTQLGDGSELRYTSLVNDSRCPPDVQCIWAGDAEIALRWKPARGSAQNIRLHTSTRIGANSARIGERTLTLASLERGIAPKATLTIGTAP